MWRSSSFYCFPVREKCFGDSREAAEMMREGDRKARLRYRRCEYEKDDSAGSRFFIDIVKDGEIFGVHTADTAGMQRFIFDKSVTLWIFPEFGYTGTDFTNVANSYFRSHKLVSNIIIEFVQVCFRIRSDDYFKLFYQRCFLSISSKTSSIGLPCRERA